MRPLLPAKGLPLLCIILWLATAFSANLLGQSIPLQKIEAQVMQGNLEALRQLAPYLDSQKQVIEYLGWHRLETTEAAVAARLIYENSLFRFPKEEFGKSVSEAEFLKFLDTHPVRWCDTLAAFVHEPWRKSDVQYRLRGLTPNQIAERSQDIQSIDKDWVLLKHWDELLRQGDPRLMPEIAAECFRNRHRFNRYHAISRFLNLIEACTHLQIAFQESDGEFTFDLDEFDKVGLLNLLNFWLTNYPAFRWNPQQDCFTSPQFPSPTPMKEADLIKALQSKDDSVAFDAFVALAQGDPEIVTALAKEHANEFSLSTNRSLGTFPHRYLMQLPWMVQYCRAHQIDYQGGKELQAWVRKLQACQDGMACRKIEQEMLAALGLADVTALEYWAILYDERYWAQTALTHVLDQLYSRHWKEVILDPAQLELYLRKAAWFTQLGIVGTCNNYLHKFDGLPEEALSALQALEGRDSALQAVVDSAITVLKGVQRKPRYYLGKSAPPPSMTLRKPSPRRWKRS